MSTQEIMSTKEALLEHLYAIIQDLSPTYASRITGMFAELSESQIMLLLGNQKLLEQKVTEAKESIISLPAQYHEVEMNTEEHLYQQVCDIEPHLGSKITGMLLELGSEVTQHLLRDQESLQLAVEQASREIQGADSSSIPEELGDAVYDAVFNLYPRNASKITGMLAELGQVKLRHLLETSSNNDLVESVESCHRVLLDTGLWIDE